jgi:hypothetical protein
VAKLSGLGKPDTKGRYTRDLGWKVRDDGRYIQHRFTLGTHRAAAEDRYLRLEHVWQVVEKRWSQAGRKTPKPLWDAVTLKIGMAVARGENVVTFTQADLWPFVSQGGDEFVSFSEAVLSYHLDNKALHSYLMELQRDFHTVKIELEKTEIERCVDECVGEVIGAARATVQGLHSLLAPAQNGTTLFQALDAWATTQVEQYKNTSEHGSRQVGRVEFLKQHIKDMPLVQLNRAAIDSILATIRNRPSTKRERPCSIDYARSLVKVVRAFVEWLDGAGVGWEKPRGYTIKPVRLRRTAEENVRRHKLPIYKREELVTLYQYASPLERVFILLSLNCGYGGGELATLQIEEIYLDIDHPEYQDHGDFIFRDRAKSTVYSEWRLWPETVEAIRWYRKHNNSESTGPLLLARGKPISFTKGGSRSQYFNNRMSSLLDRIAKDKPDFRRLSYNKLKKTAASLVKRAGGHNVAKEFIAHRQACDDPLLDLYAGRSFMKVFKAQTRVRKHLCPMFEAVPEPFPQDGKKNNPALSLEKRNKIKELRAQKIPYKVICETLNVSMDTVRRYSETKKRRTASGESS